MTEKKIELNSEQVKTGYIRDYVHWTQSCMLCENIREVPIGYNSPPWICDECREAMGFLKGFIKGCDKAAEMLKEMEKANENVHHL